MQARELKKALKSVGDDVEVFILEEGGYVVDANDIFKDEDEDGKEILVVSC